LNLDFKCEKISAINFKRLQIYYQTIENFKKVTSLSNSPKVIVQLYIMGLRYWNLFIGYQIEDKFDCCVCVCVCVYFKDLA